MGAIYLGNSKIMPTVVKNNKFTTLNVTPTTTSQNHIPPTGYDGFNLVQVAPVTNAIDSDIKASNIKSGVTILGVTGNYVGTLPTGTININSNGTYNVTNYASASVSVSGYTQIPSYTVASGTASRRSKTLINTDFSGITTIDTNGMRYAFINCSLSGTVSFPNLVTINDRGLANAFTDVTGIVNISVPNLKTVGSSGMSYAFYGCTSMGTSGNIIFSVLDSIGSQGFSYAFYGCINAANIQFPKLKTTSFGGNTNVFYNMMSNTGTSKTHTIHFPANLQTIISQMQGYPTFGGTSGYVTCAFDLPATS